MFRTTMRQLRTYKQVEEIAANYASKEEFMRAWKASNPQKIAYAAGIYGCNGHLFVTDTWGMVAQTGRTGWLFAGL